MIDYRQIDEGIRNIIFKLNSNGVRTLGSCDGMLAHHKGRNVQNAYVCLAKSPQTLDLMAACFKDRANFQIALRNINYREPDVGIEYFISFHNKHGRRTDYFNRIVTGIMEGSITVSDSERKMLSDLESILEERDSALGFSVNFDHQYKLPDWNQTKKTNYLQISDCSPTRQSIDLSWLRNAISQKFGIQEKAVEEVFDKEEFIIMAGNSFYNPITIYFTDENIARIFEVMKYARTAEATLHNSEVADERILKDYDVVPWDQELE